MSRGEPTHAEAVYLELVGSYENAILNYVYRLVGDLDVAEDLTQETFVRAFQAVGRLELEPDAAARRRAWLYRIAHNVATDHLRRKSRLAWLSLEPLRLRSSSNPEGDLVVSEPIRRAFASLSPSDQELLMLFSGEGLDAIEVAQILGISHAAARKRRQRARDQFQKAYDGVMNRDM